MLYRILTILLIFSSLQCKNAGDSDCRYGEPTPIFNPQVVGIINHQFVHEGMEGIEQLILDTGLEVEIYQTGCDEISQEFRFTLTELPPNRPKAFWMSAASACFIQLSTLEVDQIIFSQYAQAIQQFSETIEMGETVELGTGFYMKIDAVEMGEDAILRILFRSTSG